ncbi:hypothetical protein ACFJIY_20990 [Pimelobacter simplex]|uniref:hypothetical protein n=1 Tax=Nocardioides simplex TaxID=2045 RepID=UPI00366DB078
MVRLPTLLLLGALALAGCSATGSGTPAAAPAHPTPDPWADLPAGPAPAVPYVAGRRYVGPDGTRRLPGGARGVSGVVPFAGGLLVADTSYFEGTNGLALVRRGRYDATWSPGGTCSSGVPVASPDGRHVAWTTVRCPESGDVGEGAVHRARTDGSGEVVRPTGPGLVQVVGFVGSDVVYDRGFRDGAWRTDFRGPPVRIPGVDRVVALSAQGLLVGQRGDRARLVLDLRGKVRWRATAGDLSWFSPDGSRVLAVDGDRLRVLATGDGSVRAELTLPAGVDGSTVVWEGDRSLLAVAERGGRGAVVRLRLDGTAERTTAAVVRGGRAPYVLVGQ